MTPVQGIETSPDICLHSPGHGQRPTLLSPLVQRLVLTVPFSEALGAPMKLRLEEGLSHPHHRSLDQRVLAAGVASRPLLPIVLLDPDPCNGRRLRPILAPPLVEVPAVVVQVLRLLLGRDLVAPRCTALTGLSISFQQERSVTHVQHVGAPHRRIALGLLGNALELHGDGGGARSLSQRSSQTT
jgi:hypothetical protein